MTLKYLNLTGLNALVSAIKTWVLSRIPTKTSELTNDANFITSNDLPTNHVTTDTTQTITSQKTWTAEQTFSLPIAGSITGTASKAIADEDGTSIKSGYVNVAGNQTVTGDKSFTGSNTFNNILPNATNTYSLGSSTNQWSSVYAQSYYYNGTAWGLDKANTWTNVNTFSMATAESIAVKHVTYKGAILFRTNGVSNFKNYNTFLKWDINGYDNSLGLYRSIGVFGDTTTGATDEDIDTSFSLWKAHIRSKSLDFTNSVKATNDGTENSLKPITTGVTDLGTSTNKWKSLNGINPGALSLPDSSNAITLDTTNWVYDGATSNLWTATVDCWVTAYSVYTRLFILKNNTLNIGSVSERGGSYTNYVYVPARKGDVVCLIAGDASNVTVIAYPCLGNV